MSFTIAIIGRPNVGKSTLFNKLVGRKLAIVDDVPGVTRDRREAIGSLGSMQFKVVDTAGLEYEIQEEQLEARMMKQTEIAVLEADLCLLMVDGREGINNTDKYFAKWLRKRGKETILVVNKCEGKDYGYSFSNEYYKFGFGEPVAISAEHKEGFNTLYEAIEPYYDRYTQKFQSLEIETEADDEEKHLQIAIVGRPNAGKSTLINSLLGEERLVTGLEAGITRDSILIDWEFQGKKIYLVDTAGIRRRGGVKEKLEKLSLIDSFRAIRYAHVVIILIDATTVEQGIDKQDLSIASAVIKEGRGIVFGINKWDEIEEKDKIIQEVRFQLEKILPGVKGVPIVPISGLRKHNIDKLIKESLRVYESWNRRINTSKLNDWLKLISLEHAPPMFKGRQTKLKYISQIKKRPPTFILFTNNPDVLRGSYERYLINSLRRNFKIASPIRLSCKKSENPYERKRKRNYKL